MITGILIGTLIAGVLTIAINQDRIDAPMEVRNHMGDFRVYGVIMFVIATSGLIGSFFE